MRPLRIVFLIRSLEIGGAERQLTELAVGLQQAGWRVKILTFYPGGPLERELRDRGVAVEDLGKGGRWDVVGFAIRLVRALQRERPDILHGYLRTANVLAALMRPLFPRMRIVWGVRGTLMELAAYDRLADLEFRSSCRLARLADLTIHNSAAGRSAHVASGYPADRAIVIPNGIDATRFVDDPDAGATVRREWGVEPEQPLVGIVARLDPMKDHQTFLAAAALVAGRRADVRFLCVGEGPGSFPDTVKRIPATLGIDGIVTWAGARLDMPAVYSALDLLVSSSSSGEGFSNVVAEAMSTGVPCVVTDVGDSRQIVGETGWVVPPQNAPDLADAILAAITDRADLERRGRSARERVVARFTPERLVQTTAVRLESLIRGHRAAADPDEDKVEPGP